MAHEKRVSRRAVLKAGGVGALAAAAGLLATTAVQGQSDADRQRHPRLARAIDDLRDARDYLRNAPNKFGGHKSEAIEAIDRALRQLREAIKF